MMKMCTILHLKLEKLDNVDDTVSVGSCTCDECWNRKKPSINTSEMETKDLILLGL